MKVGDRVQLLYCPDHHGTISRVYPNGDFRVTYDDHNRPRKEARAKVIFSANKASLFIREGAIETAQEEPESDILAVLVKRYGIRS